MKATGGRGFKQQPCSAAGAGTPSWPGEQVGPPFGRVCISFHNRKCTRTQPRAPQTQSGSAMFEAAGTLGLRTAICLDEVHAAVYGARYREWLGGGSVWRQGRAAAQR